MTAEVVKDRRVLVIRSIHVTYHLKGVAAGAREAAERAHERHAGHCPVARSISPCIGITTQLEFAE